MPELIRESSHGNGISVIHLENIGVFRKIARNDDGRELLRNEAAGIHWYGGMSQEKGRQPLSCELWDTGAFTRLDIKQVDGFQALYTSPLARTRHRVEASLEHYLSAWPRQPRVPCHGDLTLDNILYIANARPVFFDWEHYSGEGECWGFDMAYFLLSALILPAPDRDDWALEERQLFRTLWRRLVEAGLSADLATDPVTYFRQVFGAGRHWQKITAQSPRKLFPLWMSESQQRGISRLLAQEAH